MLTHAPLQLTSGSVHIAAHMPARADRIERPESSAPAPSTSAAAGSAIDAASEAGGGAKRTAPIVIEGGARLSGLPHAGALAALGQPA